MADMNKVLCNVQQILTPAQQLQARKNIGAFGNDNVAPEYDPEATYPIIGTPCIHEGVLYKSKVAINTAEAWNAEHWFRTNLIVDAPENGLYVRKNGEWVRSDGFVLLESSPFTINSSENFTDHTNNVYVNYTLGMAVVELRFYRSSRVPNSFIKGYNYDPTKLALKSLVGCQYCSSLGTDGGGNDGMPICALNTARPENGFVIREFQGPVYGAYLTQLYIMQ